MTDKELEGFYEIVKKKYCQENHLPDMFFNGDITDDILITNYIENLILEFNNNILLSNSELKSKTQSITELKKGRLTAIAGGALAITSLSLQGSSEPFINSIGIVVAILSHEDLKNNFNDKPQILKNIEKQFKIKIFNTKPLMYHAVNIGFYITEFLILSKTIEFYANRNYLELIAPIAFIACSLAYKYNNKHYKLNKKCIKRQSINIDKHNNAIERLTLLKEYIEETKMNDKEKIYTKKRD